MDRVPTSTLSAMLDMGRTTDGFDVSFKTNISDLEIAAAAWDWQQQYGMRETFGVSLTQFPKKEQILILVNDPEKEDITKRLNNLMLSRLATILRAQPNANRVAQENNRGEVVEPRHFYIVDEAVSVGKIPGLQNLMREGRGRGVSVTIAFQNAPGMKQVYGEDGLAELVDLCNSWGVLRTDGPSADIVAQWFGDYPTLDRTQSINEKGEQTTSESFSRENVLEASELRALSHVDRPNRHVETPMVRFE